jgi:hypothetical protein
MRQRVGRRQKSWSGLAELRTNLRPPAGRMMRTPPSCHFDPRMHEARMTRRRGVAADACRMDAHWMLQAF